MSRCVEVLDVVRPPSLLPVGLDEVRIHLRVEPNTEHDADLREILATATQYVQDRTGLVLCAAGYRWTLDYFPSCPALVLPVRPVLSLDGFRYRDMAGDWQDVDPELYCLVGGANPPLLRLQPQAVWPTTYADAWNTVEIELTAGHGLPSLVPLQARRAILLLCGQWWLHREAMAEKALGDVGYAVEALCSQIAEREVP